MAGLVLYALLISFIRTGTMAPNISYNYWNFNQAELVLLRVELLAPYIQPYIVWTSAQ